jgi:hypothetical protein
MPRTAKLTDEFLRLEVTKFYQYGAVGPRSDRARRLSTKLAGNLALSAQR